MKPSERSSNLGLSIITYGENINKNAEPCLANLNPRDNRFSTFFDDLKT